MRIATFNVQNLRLRHSQDGDILSGARDRDEPVVESAAAYAVDTIDRRLTAEILRRADADIVALQEVFDQETLDYFHERFLLPCGAAAYPHRICLPGNDGRGFDVALMSRTEPDEVANHAALTVAEVGLDVLPGRDPGEPVFRRDCLSARFGSLTVFVCHFKAPYPDPDIAWFVRRQEALAVRWLIERRFADPRGASWMVLGDLNEPAEEPRGERAVAPLLTDFAVDLTQRVAPERRWSYHMEETGIYSRPDALLASPALASAFPDAKPFYLREGLGHDTPRFSGERLAGVGYRRPHASDHAALAIDLEGLA
ncbi:endonuclease/exonuclease/phosphatase family protein [Oricola sp.]|uniref:endonuclease/exonuclease/phosphatase family protein n=1 Tax=Oricola sp. TaxID=1979950 RepID=UPI0025EC710E|nr:endonuclease/exonuclease/phosphatase family protein [Oricola sp.]MCI5076964.1 endonuclease/exonuclease/phosphatase family protein [Oricola sp.]